MLQPAYSTNTPAPVVDDRDRYTATGRWFTALALGSAALTAAFLVLGIQATEPESPARWAKVAAGIFLIAVELSAFGAVAWLAGRDMRLARVLLVVLGAAVIGLDVTVMSITQIAIGTSADHASTAVHGHAQQLRDQIKAARDTSATLRANAARQTDSRHDWSRQQAAKTAALAAQTEASIAPLVAQLAEIERSAVGTSATVASIAGQNWMIGVSIALSVILTASGLISSYVAGKAFKRAQGALTMEQQILGFLHELRGAPAPLQQLRDGSPAPTRLRTFKRHSPRATRFKIKTAGRPAVSLSKQQDDAEPDPEPEPAPPAAGETETVRRPRARVVRPTRSKDTGTSAEDGSRYQRVLAAVQAGELTPSVRNIQKRFGGSPQTIQGYQNAMLAAGVIVQAGQGYKRAIPN